MNKGSSANSGKSHGWLVSFGDLLTLLLCFFLSIVSFGPLNPNHQKKNAALTPEAQWINKKLRLPPEVFGGDGITIALSESGAPRLRFGFSAADFVPRGEELLPAALDRMVQAVNSAGYPAEEMRLEACLREPGVNARNAWFMTAERVMAMKRQLIDAGINGQTLKLRALGRSCEGLQGGLAGQIAGVSFDFPGAVHG